MLQFQQIKHQRVKKLKIRKIYLKKQRLSNNSDTSTSESEQHAPNDNIKTNKKKPQRAAKTKAKNKISKSKKRSTIEVILKKKSIEQPKDLLVKTPSTNRLRIEALLESTQKTIKAAEPVRPITRANGKVKQAVEIFEQMRAQQSTATKSQVPIPTAVLASAAKARIEDSERILRVNASKLRSSIDKRKLRSSQAKQQIKRKSVKKVNAFVKAATADLNTTSTLKPPPPSTTTNIIDQTIQEESGKSERRITHDILSATTVQQHYRVANFKSTMKLPGERKISILSSNFLERNTPSKLTKTV